MQQILLWFWERGLISYTITCIVSGNGPAKEAPMEQQAGSSPEAAPGVDSGENGGGAGYKATDGQ